MKIRHSISVFCLSTLFPSLAHTTTIIVEARHGQIYIGADGRRNGGSNGQNTTSFQVCKIEQYGAVIVAHFGEATVQGKPDRTGRMPTIFDADTYVRKAVRVPGSISEKADALEKTFWDRYKNIVTEISGMASPAVRDTFIKDWKATGFVLAGKGEDGRPQAIALGFQIDPAGRPFKVRYSLPRDTRHFTAGYIEAIPTTGPDPFSGDTSKAIMFYLRKEAELNPMHVGGPYAIARIDGDGVIHFDQQGACQKQVAKK